MDKVRAIDAEIARLEEELISIKLPGFSLPSFTKKPAEPPAMDVFRDGVLLPALVSLYHVGITAVKGGLNEGAYTDTKKFVVRVGSTKKVPIRMYAYDGKYVCFYQGGQTNYVATGKPHLDLDEAFDKKQAITLAAPYDGAVGQLTGLLNAVG